jgi:hypothetical protein
MRGFIVKSAQNTTALTTAKAAMKVQSINTIQGKECFHLAQGNLIMMHDALQ